MSRSWLSQLTSGPVFPTNPTSASLPIMCTRTGKCGHLFLLHHRTLQYTQAVIVDHLAEISSQWEILKISASVHHGAANIKDARAQNDCNDINCAAISFSCAKWSLLSCRHYFPIRGTTHSCWQSGQRLFCLTHNDIQQLWNEWLHSPQTTMHSSRLFCEMRRITWGENWCTCCNAYHDEYYNHCNCRDEYAVWVISCCIHYYNERRIYSDAIEIWGG